MGTERVLVVDDDAAVRGVVRRTLEAQGYDVTEAANGLTALELMLTSQHFDLLISDAAMPGLSGPELLARWQEFSPSTRLVLISGYIEHGLPAWGPRSEPVVGLGKPFEPEQLLRVVQRVLQSDRAG